MTRTLYISIIASVFLLAFIDISISQVPKRGTRPEAVALVKKVKAIWNTEGPEQTVTAVNRLTHNLKIRDLYPFIHHTDGYVVAHFVQAIRGLKEPENTEYPIVRKMAAFMKKQKSGWVDYLYVNPITKRIGKKSAYLESLGDGYYVGVGIYARISEGEIPD